MKHWFFLMQFHNIEISFYFLWSESYFWKHLFLFWEFLIIKTTFSYFPGIFKNLAPVLKTSCNRNINLKKKLNQYYYLILIFYNPSQISQLSEFIWVLRSSVWVIFNNFLLIDATDRFKISSNHHRIFFDLSLIYPFYFFKHTL